MQRLTKAEEEIMHAIWSLEKATVGEVISWLYAQNPKEAKPANSTISTMLRIMEEKGFLSHETVGRVFQYHPIVSKSEYAGGSLRSLINDYFSGSAGHLVSALVKQESLSESEINDLIKLLDENDTQKR